MTINSGSNIDPVEAPEGYVAFSKAGEVTVSKNSELTFPMCLQLRELDPGIN